MNRNWVDKWCVVANTEREGRGVQIMGESGFSMGKQLSIEVMCKPLYQLWTAQRLSKGYGSRRFSHPGR